MRKIFENFETVDYFKIFIWALKSEDTFHPLKGRATSVSKLGNILWQYALLHSNTGCCRKKNLLQGLKLGLLTLLAKTVKVVCLQTRCWKGSGDLGGNSDPISTTVVLQSRAPYKKYRGFRWLYTGCKQLEIEWKPDVILNKKGHHSQKTFSWTYTTQIL